jgi:N-acetyldiaminopimelate deacetylase
MSTISPIELRHKLHQIPELMFQEVETTRLLLDAVGALSGIIIHRPVPTGLVAEYRVNDGDYLLFRADIDALPIKEETGLEFVSRNECMHACGHDVHASVLYGFLQQVVELNINQNILFLFQPGEEGGGGAKSVIDSGIFSGYHIRNAFALHVSDDYPLGTIASTSGTLFAAAIELDVIIHGKQAHVAFPSRGINSLTAMRKFLDDTDAIVNSYDEPVLFGCGKVTSGTVRNIIPAIARAECTIRALSVETLDDMIERFKEALQNISKEMGVRFELNQNAPYTEVQVNDSLFGLCKKELGTAFQFIDCGYKMTAEDFGLFSRTYPAFMAWLGTSKGEHYGLHTPKFFPPDEAIQKGIEAFTCMLKAVQKK